MHSIVKFGFYGDELSGVHHSDRVIFPLRPVCKALDVSVVAQPLRGRNPASPYVSRIATHDDSRRKRDVLARIKPFGLLACAKAVP